MAYGDRKPLTPPETILESGSLPRPVIVEYRFAPNERHEITLNIADTWTHSGAAQPRPPTTAWPPGPVTVVTFRQSAGIKNRTEGDYRQAVRQNQRLRRLASSTPPRLPSMVRIHDRRPNRDGLRPFPTPSSSSVLTSRLAGARRSPPSARASRMAPPCRFWRDQDGDGVIQ